VGAVRDTKKLRALVFARAADSCECGCRRYIGNDQGRLDHFFGRAKVAQALSNCWALSIDCDIRKTLNEPSGAYWLERFIVHAERHGYVLESERARAKLQVLQAKGRAA
jgi:hypothetical protein